MSLLQERLGRGRALMPYLTASDPTPELSFEAALGAIDGGARAIEVGIPFSDPVADGPVIQAAHHRALQAGGGVGPSLQLVAGIRERSDAPVVLFTYLNPILAHGAERFASAALAAGADGVLVLDLPPEEEPAWFAFLRGAGLDPIVLDSPNTSPARARAIASEGRGFVYVVSREGVTGTHATASGGLEQRIADLRKSTDLPLAVGFGVREPADVSAIWSIAECAVVGSAFVEHLHRDPRDPRGRAAAFVRNLLVPSTIPQESLP
jgi:tryptophan synthase alpha chain